MTDDAVEAEKVAKDKGLEVCLSLSFPLSLPPSLLLSFSRAVLPSFPPLACSGRVFFSWSDLGFPSRQVEWVDSPVFGRYMLTKFYISGYDSLNPETRNPSHPETQHPSPSSCSPLTKFYLGVGIPQLETRNSPPEMQTPRPGASNE